MNASRETARHHRPAVERAALDAIGSRRPGRPSKQLDATQPPHQALLVVNQMLLYLLRRLVGERWHGRLPLEIRSRLGGWIEQLREQLGISCLQIALWLGVDRKKVFRWQQAARQKEACIEP